MAESLVHNASPVEYFRELVDSAMRRQHLSTRQLTSFYLVNLLAGFVHFDRSPASGDDGPLGVRFVKALQEAGVRQRDELRQVGDLSLFISGFFADSLTRSLVDIDYYIQLGEHAYGSLARQGDGTFGDVFDELSGKFPAFVDVLGEVSERSALTSNADLLRLYERWLRTRSRRSGDLLASRGIVPNASVGSRFVQ
ncbi:MAG: hypothetical protein HYX77_05470 [Acidobacteria bacterium]|nr:hypothetical protein [Acidobacteriota bacterium]